MLPNIKDVAEQNGIDFDVKTLNKNQINCKCPFCREDANKERKYYLTLNVDKNVFRCWFCKLSGGVIEFESRLTGTHYDELLNKYSKKKKRGLRLNNRQLEAIGIEKNGEIDRQVKKKWIAYEQSMLSLWFAQLVVINYLPVERRNNLLEALVNTCKKSVILNAYEKITEEFIKNDSDKAKWALEGLSLARISWQMASDINNFDNVVTHIAFIHYLNEKRKESFVNQQQTD